MVYVPRRGDVIWLTFQPQAGHEQTGRRPALVVSPKSYNGKVGLVIVCPITRQVKGYPFEVALPPDLGVEGVVLADQVKSLDWRARDADFHCVVPAHVLDEVIAKLRVLIEVDLA